MSGPLDNADYEEGACHSGAAGCTPCPADWLHAEILHTAGNWCEFDSVSVHDAIAEAVAAVAGSQAVRRYDAAAVCVVLSNAEAVRKLNAAYRRKNAATNVLSFPAAGSVGQAGIDGEPRLLGDIILSQETIWAEAAEFDLSAKDHLQHLVVHGLLHLFGFDHETERDAEVMEALETEILASLGIANPYIEHSAHGAERAWKDTQYVNESTKPKPE